MHNHTLVFLAGLHRSGTSLLEKCLQDHPAISGLTNTGVPEDEGQHLQSVYPTALDLGGPGAFGFNPQSHLTEKSPLATPANARILFDAWSKWWDLSKPMLAEKSPPNLLRTRFMQALFPTAAFVVILRHPIAVTGATLKMNPQASYASILKHWVVCHEIFERDRPFLNKVTTLHYEDFVTRPQETLDRIHAFLGLPACPLKREVKPDVNTRYAADFHARGHHLPGRLHLGLLKLQLEKRIRQFGYSLWNPDLVEPYPHP